MVLLMEEIMHQLIDSLAAYPIIDRVWYILGGAWFQPSTVVYSTVEWISFNE